ncbi:MAG: response regulator transcription factor [Bacteroidia bacterium]
MKSKILYVEDEPFLGKIVKETLEHRGFEVLHKPEGSQVMESFNSFVPDVCVLDVMLPNVDGYTLGRQIRNRYPRLPIIFLTAKTQTEDVVKGFESGGTDYIKKPFSIEELIVRINNQLQLLNGAQQISNENQIEIALGSFRFIPHRYELHSKKKVIKLSHRESQVLRILTTHQNKIVDRKDLLLSVWGDDSFFNSRTLDVYIRKLREYFSSEEGIEIITLKGKGYHFLVPKS